jgi:short-subunit dehydrogenase
MGIAVVTGASSGLGREYALQLAGQSDVDEVWLNARRRDRLEEVAGELDGAAGRVFDFDLTDEDKISDFLETVEAEDPEVRWLVNNAGMGKYGSFNSVGVQTNLKIIDLNIRALTHLTQGLTPFCTRSSRILQVASTAGFFPTSGFSLYAATKAFVVHLTEALAVEYEEMGIQMTAVCPGPVETEFHERAGDEENNVWPDFLMATPDEIVEKSIHDAKRGRTKSVYGMLFHVGVAVSGLLPSSLSARVSQDMLEA